MERPVSFRNIISLRKHSGEHGGYKDFVAPVSRGLVTVDGFKYKGYDEVLPKFEGKNFSSLMEDKIRESDGVVSLLDVGYGRGRFLIDCKLKWGDKINCIGVGYHDLRDEDYSNELGNDGVEKYPTRQILEELGIEVIHTDAQSLSRNTGIKDVDIAVSAFCFMYFADPLSGLKEVYKSLKPGGIGLIQGNIFEKVERRKLLLNFQREYGLEVNLFGTSFRKDSNRLHVPFKYSSPHKGELTYH